MSEDDVLTIGEVINLLRDEFPDVSISKLRFLEAQGLLTPDRSEGGYRQFDSHDLARLRFILRQQRDHFLPLKVIKSKLTLWERGEEPEGEGKESGPASLAQPVETVGRSEIIRRSGIRAGLFDELLSHGILSPMPSSPDSFDPAMVAIASEAKQLLAKGLEARHIRAVKHAAERESDVLSQLVGAQLMSNSEDTRESAKKLLRSTADSILGLHRVMFLSELRKLLEP